MAYDERLAERIRAVLAGRDDVAEKKMFGGIAFMIRGHMSVGIVRSDLMIRVGPGTYEGVVRMRHARPMDFTGKPMKDFVYVAPAGLDSDADLERWIGYGVSFAASLPPKPRATPRPKKRAARRTNRA